MTDDQYDNLALVGRHVPDFSMEQGDDGTKQKVPLPGVYEVGINLGGKFRAFWTFKAGDLVDDNNVVQAGDQAAPAASGGSDQSGVIAQLEAKVHELEAKLSGGSSDEAPAEQS